MTVKFIDVYSPNVLPSNWLTLPGFFHKVSQGTWNFQTAFTSRRAQYSNTKGVFGGYHAHMGDEDAVAQAKFFLGKFQPRLGDVIILDFEDFLNPTTGKKSWAGKTNAQLAKSATDFMNYCDSRYPNNRKILYCNRSDYNNIVKPYKVPVKDGLWLATLDNTFPTTYPWLICQYAVINNVDWNQGKFTDAAAMKTWANKAIPKTIKGQSQMDVCTLVDGTIVYVVVGDENDPNPGRLYVSFDLGQTWSYVGDGRYMSGASVTRRGTGDRLEIVTRDAGEHVHLVSVPDVKALDHVTDQTLGRPQDRLAGPPGITTNDQGVFIAGEGLDGYIWEIHSSSAQGGAWSPWNKTKGRAL